MSKKILQEQQEALILAEEGLKTQIAYRHGMIKNEFETQTYRLLRSIFGYIIVDRQRPGEDEIEVANNHVAKYKDKYVRRHRQKILVKTIKTTRMYS